MPEAGSTFTDWQQVERDNLLFVGDDFGWSEPPRRRRITEGAGSTRRGADAEPAHAERRVAVLDHEPEHFDDHASRVGHERGDQRGAPERSGSWAQPTAVHSHFDEMMEEWNASYGEGARDADVRAGGRPFDLSEPAQPVPSDGARRTVLITGRGDDRYLPAPRQRRGSELRFHERSSFSPDRAGLWAVLLGIALVIGCIAH